MKGDHFVIIKTRTNLMLTGAINPYPVMIAQLVCRIRILNEFVERLKERLEKGLRESF